MMGRLQVICTTDQIKEAKRNVQKYMRKHKSDEDFIDNISDDFVMGFMISQRMAWGDYDNGTQRENDDFGKWIPCSERLPEDEGYILVSFELEEVKPERTVREIREIRTPDPESEEEEGQLPGQMSDEDLSEVAEHMKAMMKILEKYRKE